MSKWQGEPLNPGDWAAVMGSLLDTGKVVQQGERRGATYTLV
jgi:hypothetical protein